MKAARETSFHRALAAASPRDRSRTGRAVPGPSLIESVETLRAIRSGEVDAVLLAGKDGQQVFSLEGGEHPYRVLIESMNEGALTLTADKMILYANACFARMVNCPLERVIGSSFHRFISAVDRERLRSVIREATKAGAKVQMVLQPVEGAALPVQISVRPLAGKDRDDAAVSMVVTDVSAARRNEEMLRALTHRVIQVQEAERGRLAIELHDNITQLLCAALVRSQALTESISVNDGTSRRAAAELREMLGQTAQEVERISRDLRPGMLEQLGLVEVLRDTTKDFAGKAGVAVSLTCGKLGARLPPDTELALVRILQEAFKNIARHARAGRVTVDLQRQADFVQFVIRDDGIGFMVNPRAAGRKAKRGLGLLSMRERASFVGGAFEITSARGTGTEIKVRVPSTVAAA